MRRLILYPIALVLLLSAIVGCASHDTTTADNATSDSLLSSNPIEPPAGDITPQGDLEQPAPATQTDTKSASTTPSTKTTTPKSTPSKGSGSTPAQSPGYAVAAGTGLNIAMNTQITTETANVGDTWTGELKDNVIVGDHVAFAAGSVVSGKVTEVIPAEKGSLAKLGLSVTSISSNGETYNVNAAMEPIEAGSPRARNLGAVAGGAAAGALIGKAVGGGGKGALIGGLVGAAASGAAVAKSKGYQVVVKEGMILDFKTSSEVKIRS